MLKLALIASLLCTACVPVTIAPIAAGAGAGAGAGAEPAESVPGLASPEQVALNAIRREAGSDPVVRSDRLTQVAQGHARDLAQNGLFSHQGSDGSSVGQRARRAGYGFCAIAENIAQGQRSLDEVMRGWRNSPGHLRNMVSPKYTQFGLARAEGDIWVMVLGRPGC